MGLTELFVLALVLVVIGDASARVEKVHSKGDVDMKVIYNNTALSAGMLKGDDQLNLKYQIRPGNLSNADWAKIKALIDEYDALYGTNTKPNSKCLDMPKMNKEQIQTAMRDMFKEMSDLLYDLLTHVFVDIFMKEKVSCH